ncbi:MAG TPA: TIGR03086 family metal-binding protein [Acidothermaceae bacterium]
MTEVPPTTFDLIVQGIDAFGDKVRAVPADRWAAPTPCTDWSVRDLVNHVTGEHLWAPHLLDGETIAQVGDRYDGDVLGDSPVKAWERAAEASRGAWLSASPDAVVHLSFGDNPALEYGQQMLSDLLIHGWDLARGAGLDETMDSAAVAMVLVYMEANAKSWEAAGIFAPPVHIDSDDPAKRLVALSGRQP